MSTHRWKAPSLRSKSQKEETALWVYEGRVRFSNTLGQLLIASGEAALARAGETPERRIVVKPRRAVEWALYYPPLLDTRPERYPEAAAGGACLAYRQNDFPAAFARARGTPAQRPHRALLHAAGGVTPECGARR